MKTFDVQILGNDQRVYGVEHFISEGKAYLDAIGIVFGSSVIGQRILEFDSWAGIWDDTDQKLI